MTGCSRIAVWKKLEPARGLDPWRCPNGSQPLGTRMFHTRALGPMFDESSIRSLSRRDFETRTANGSDLFSLVTRLHAITFTLLSHFSALGMISIKMWETPLSWHEKCPLPVAFHVSKTRVLKHNDDGNKSVTKMHIWQCKTMFLHALHVHFSFFYILQTFSFFPRREMTCFAVGWTTWAYNDKYSILYSYVSLMCWFQFYFRVVRTHFASIMTLR